METIRVDTAPARAGVLPPGVSPGWLALRGALALTLGALAILFPANALFAFTMVFAAFAAADGLFSLVEAYRGRRERGRVWPLALRGAVGVLVGVLFVVAPLVSTLSYAMVTLALLAAWCIATGVLEIVAAVKLRREIKGEWLLGLSGVLSILLGAAVPALLVFNPASTLLSVAWVIGFYAVVVGVVLLGQAARLKRRAGDTPAPSSAMPATA